MKRIASLLLLSNLGLFAQQGSVQLLWPTEGRCYNLPKQPEGRWQALVRTTDGGFELRAVRLSVSKPCDPQQELETTKIVLDGTNAADTLILIRGVQLQAGKAPAAEFKRESEEPKLDGFRHPETHGRFRKQPFNLVPIQGGPPSKRRASPFQLRLEIHGRSQVLFGSPGSCGPDCTYDLAWAGDLDGDGKLDLLVRSGPEYLQDDVYLFLSTMARKGELVGLVGLSTRSLD